MSERERNPHSGHRQRMRERFRREGLEGFADHEVLELLLYNVITRADVNPVAHALMDTFGSLKGVLEAGVDQLRKVEGVGEQTATMIAMMVPLFRRYMDTVTREKQVISGLAEAAQYCLSLTAGLRVERAYAICLGADHRLLGCRLICEGSIDEVSAYPRHVVEAALNHNAHGVILCHNHPGGTPEPSAADLEWTAQVQAVLAGIGVLLVDHIIVADGKSYSMVQHGELLQTEEQT